MNNVYVFFNIIVIRETFVSRRIEKLLRLNFLSNFIYFKIAAFSYFLSIIDNIQLYYYYHVSLFVCVCLSIQKINSIVYI